MSRELSLRSLARLTPARIGLDRVGTSVLLGEVLAFQLAHARARDAVHTAFGDQEIAADLGRKSLRTMTVTSAASSRETYLRRPDLGRKLSAASRSLLQDAGEPAPDLVVVVADGLSADAHRHTVPFLDAFREIAQRRAWTMGPVILAHQARVALGDEIGIALRARAVLVLIGERPGLSSPDSLGAYLTLLSRADITDADRNCVSSIRSAGLAPAQAASKVAWLLQEAFTRGHTGVALKDESGTDSLISPPSNEVCTP